MKKKLHIIVIEYPIVTIIIIFLMIAVLVTMCKLNKVDKYYEVSGTVTFSEKENFYLAKLVIPNKYYAGVKIQNNVIWYTDLESAVYKATISDISIVEDKCEILLKVDADEYEKEQKKMLIFKLSYDMESVLDKLITELQISK